MKRLTGPAVAAILAAAVLAISFIWSPEALPRVSLCFFNRVTGLPCPGCGLTRGFCALSHGRLLEAWALNPFSFLFYAAAVALALRPLIAWLMPEVERRLYQPRALVLAPVAVCGMWLFGTVRLLWLVKV